MSALTTFVVPSSGLPSLERSLHSLLGNSSNLWRAHVVQGGAEMDLSFLPHDILNDKRLCFQKLGEDVTSVQKLRDTTIQSIETPWVSFLNEGDTVSPQYVSALEAWASTRNKSSCLLFRLVNKEGRIIPDVNTKKLSSKDAGISMSVKSEILKAQEFPEKTTFGAWDILGQPALRDKVDIHPAVMYHVGRAASDPIFYTHPPSLPIHRSQKNLSSVVADPKITLIQQFYIPQDGTRKNEIRTCLKINAQNKYISNIILMNERIYTPDELGYVSDKVKQVNIGQRLTYQLALEFAQTLGCFVLLSNADIFFDQSIVKACRANLITDRHAQCLLRWEVKGVRALLEAFRNGCQDAWILHSNSIPMDPNFKFGLDFAMGLAGCDNAVASRLVGAGYSLHNEPGSVRAFHLHKDLNKGVHNLREEHAKTGRSNAPPPYLLVAPFVEHSVLKTRKISDPRAALSDCENTPNQLTKQNLLCRQNSINFFRWLEKNLGFLKLYVGREATALKNSTAEIVVYIDHPTRSCCECWNTGTKQESRLLIGENISEDAGFQWPIGLESKMLLHRQKDLQIFLSKANSGETQERKLRVINTVTGGPYKTPVSRNRDDRTAMNTDLGKIYPVKKSGFQDYLRTLKKSAYSLCPEGNGIDTHRFYESYAMGARPTVRRGTLTPLHARFGAKIVTAWKDVPQIQDHEIFQSRLEKLTVGYWAYQALRSRCEIVQFFTSGLIEQWKNFLESARRVGVADLIVVYPLDDESKQACIQEGIRYREKLLKNVHTGTTDFYGKNWKQLMNQKIVAIQDALNRRRFILYLDTDVVLRRDPFANIFARQLKDIWIQSDSKEPTGTKGIFCAGCVFFCPTHRSIALVKQWGEEKRWNDDQKRLNETLAASDIDLGILDRAFANGTAYWETIRDKDSEIRERWKTQDPVLIHNNWIVGVENKNYRFRKSGLWLLNEVPAPPIPVLIHHEGTYPDYLRVSIRQALRMAQRVILLGSEGNKDVAQSLGCEYIDSEKYAGEGWAKLERELSSHKGNLNITMATQRVDYFSYRRFFVLKNAMRDLGISEVFFLDSDMLLLVPPELACHPTLPTIQVMFQKHALRMSAMPTGRIDLSTLEKFVSLTLDIFVTKTKTHLVKDKIEYHKKNRGRVVDMTIWYLLAQELDHFNPHDGINNLYMCNSMLHPDGKTSANTYRMSGINMDLEIKDSKVYAYDLVEDRKKRLSIIHCLGGAKDRMQELYEKINSI